MWQLCHFDVTAWSVHTIPSTDSIGIGFIRPQWNLDRHMTEGMGGRKRTEPRCPEEEDASHGMTDCLQMHGIVLYENEMQCTVHRIFFKLRMHWQLNQLKIYQTVESSDKSSLMSYHSNSDLKRILTFVTQTSQIKPNRKSISLKHWNSKCRSLSAVTWADIDIFLFYSTCTLELFNSWGAGGGGVWYWSHVKMPFYLFYN